MLWGVRVVRVWGDCLGELTQALALSKGPWQQPPPPASQLRETSGALDPSEEAEVSVAGFTQQLHHYPEKQPLRSFLCSLNQGYARVQYAVDLESYLSHTWRMASQANSQMTSKAFHRSSESVRHRAGRGEQPMICSHKLGMRSAGGWLQSQALPDAGWELLFQRLCRRWQKLAQKWGTAGS